jgi:amidase
VAVDPYLGWTMAWPFNMLGRCPVLALPSGHAATAACRRASSWSVAAMTMPAVFRAGLAFEAAVGGWYLSAETRPALPF